MKFYTYLWLRDFGTPYYVGKGTGNRAYLSCRQFKCPSRDRIIIQYHPTEEDALTAERFLISFYGKKVDGSGYLVNILDGGTGNSGFRASEETKEKLRQIMLGNKHLLGHVHSAETRMKLSQAGKGRKFTEEHKARIAAALSGKKKSPEHIAKLIEFRSTPEWRLRASEFARRPRGPRPNLKAWATRRQLCA